MLSAISHRGPDDSGIFERTTDIAPQTSVMLGSVRLAIQDLSAAGHQPMVDSHTGNAIAFNGEIYNFMDLRQRLTAGGHVFRSRCDTEVALRSWSSDGNRAFEQWRGMFGAALWQQNRAELTLVRDPWGIKPLYYWMDDDSLLFCSEVRGLLASGIVPAHVSRRGVEDYLRFGAIQDPVTLINNVYALLPGHTLRWGKKKREIRNYYTPSPNATHDIADLDTVLRQIVGQEMISDVPIGVFLSGGIDSSIIALLAHAEAGSRVNTISLNFRESRFAEGQYSREVAAHIGTHHHEVMLTVDEAKSKVIEAVRHMDQPSVDGVNTYVISEAAQQLGFKVVLSGLGGDEFFGGYRTFRHISRLQTIRRCAARVPAAARPAAMISRAIAVAGFDGFGRLANILENDNFNDDAYLSARSLFFASQVAALVTPATRVPEADRLAEERLEALRRDAGEYDELNRISLLEARLYMANTLLRDSDQMSMAHSLELRVPFVDSVLGAFLLGASGKSKGLGDGSKPVLRSLYAPKLPETVFKRRKMGFTLPFSEWLKGPLAEDVGQSLGTPFFLWNMPAVQHVWHGFQSGRIHWTRPWALFVLRHWIEQHVAPKEDLFAHSAASRSESSYGLAVS